MLSISLQGFNGGSTPLAGLIKRKGDHAMLRVVFLVIESGARVEKVFDSEYLCRKFVNKLRHSKRCKLISYPSFS